MQNRNYEEIEQNFIDYLEQTSKRKIISARKGVNGQVLCPERDYMSRLVGDQYIDCSVHDYGHRWSNDYAKRFFYRLWLLEKWYRWHQGDVTFMTMTTEQPDGCAHEDQIIHLRDGYKYFFEKMRDYKLDISYLASMDFHRSGYAHYHVVFFKPIPLWFQAYISQLWLQRKFGSEKNGLNFRKRKQGEIAHIVSYLFKHAGKIFTGQTKPGWLRFHSVIYSMYHSSELDSDGVYEFPRIRLFSMSKDIRDVMRLPKIEGACLIAKDGQMIRYKMDDFCLEDQKDIEAYLKWFSELKI